MLARCRGRPGGFCGTYGRRDTIKICIPAIKDRFNSRIRSVTPEMQRREIAVMSACWNPCLIGDKKGSRLPGDARDVLRTHIGIQVISP